MVNKDLSGGTQDFILGKLATDTVRLDELRRRSRGLWHGGRITPADPEPGYDVTVIVTVGGDISVRQMVVLYTVDGSLPDASSPALPMVQVEPRWDSLTWGYVEDWAVSLPAQDAGVLVHYRIQAMTDAGAEIWADTNPDSGEPALFGYGVDNDHVPGWLRQAVIYSVSVDRFAPDPGKAFVTSHGNGIQGGTLKGLIARLDHIVDLGATAICLSPIFPSSSDHGYDTSVDPELGTEEDLVRLIDAAHKRDIRVLLDLVANRASSQAPDDDLIDAATHFLERGVDGFRIDGAIGLSHAFWSRCRRALRAVKPDVALIGEIVERADTMASYTGRLDGSLDFLLLQQMRAFFAFDHIDASGFWRFLSRHLASMPADLALPSVLDNHDTNRFLWAAGGDVRRLKIAALVQCALPQPPVITYGSEVGLSQRFDVENPDDLRQVEESRMPMLWGEQQDRDLRSFYRALIFWRKSQNVHATSPMHVYAGEGGLLCFRTGHWFVIVNRSDEDAAIDFQEHGEVWLALGTEFDVQLHGSAIQLPPMSGAILRA